MPADLISSFVYRYFLVDGYNIVNTLAYGLILGLAVFGTIPFLRRIGVSFDRRFVYSLIPYLFYGGTTRELVDQHLGIYSGLGPYPQNYMFVAPGIYVTMFSVTALTFALSRLLAKERYHLMFSGVGILLAGYNLALMVPNIENFEALALILLFFSMFAALTILFAKNWLRFLMFEKNYYVVLAHLLDASATFVGVDYLGFSEKHVLPSFLIERLGTAFIMFPLKLAVLIPALYYIDKDVRDDVLSRRFLKLVILAIGIGPALRDITLAIL
ncbi:MAG: DUF63 family protein [Candidatus Altiarchaeota archaeon]